MAEIYKFLLSHDMKVILVVFDRKAFELSGKLVGILKSTLTNTLQMRFGMLNTVATMVTHDVNAWKDWSLCIRR